MWSDFLTIVLIVMSATILVRGCDAPRKYDAGAVVIIPAEYEI